MTEEEAKTKWCPFVRLAIANGATMNRDAEHTDSHSCIDSYGGWANKCIGSKCMAWRWAKLEEVKEGGHSPQAWPDVARYHDNDTPRRFIRHGYCGLAGLP